MGDNWAKKLAAISNLMRWGFIEKKKQVFLHHIPSDTIKCWGSGSHGFLVLRHSSAGVRYLTVDLGLTLQRLTN